MFYAQLEKVMQGEAPIESVSQTTLSFQIYREACKVLAAHRHHRAIMCDDMPKQIGDLVRAEVIRIYGMRRQAPRSPIKAQVEKPVHTPEFANWI